MSLGIWIILAIIVVIIIICIVYCIYNGTCCKKNQEEQPKPSYEERQDYKPAAQDDKADLEQGGTKWSWQWATH